jgi:G:T-mismatch repair DNA endonuclease (very short patch repair protein)
MRSNAIKALENRKFRMTKPERKVKEWFRLNNIENHYNFILNRKYQYDFRIKKTNILVEVHGDYWHANPNIYNEAELNDRQKFKIEQDKKKLLYAEEHGYKIMYIWEQDIKNNDYSALYALLEKDQDEV